MLKFVGCALLARRQRRRKMIRIAKRVRKMRPPTTPPTIALMGVLYLGWGVGVVVGFMVVLARV